MIKQILEGLQLALLIINPAKKELIKSNFRPAWVGFAAALLLVLVACSSPSRVVIIEFGAVQNPESRCTAGGGIPIAVEVDNPANLPLDYQWITSPIPAQMNVSSPRAPAGIYECPATSGEQTITVKVTNQGKAKAQSTINIAVIAPVPTSTPTTTPVPSPVPTVPAAIPRPTPTPIAVAPLTPARPTEPIVFADLNWPSAELQNAIAKFIINHGYGYPTDGIPGSAEPLWQSLFNGNVQVFMEAWLPNHKEWWDIAMVNGSGIPLGKSLDDNWQSAFAVPTYVVEGDPARGIAPMAPDLKTAQDLRKYRELFATETSGGKAVLMTCVLEWSCAKINRAQVTAYGLEDVIEFQVPEDSGVLFGSLESAYERGEPWLGYMWAPTKSSVGLDLTRLEEPHYSLECWNGDKGCAYPISHVRIVVHPSLIGRAPEVVEFLRKWDLDTETQIAAEKYIEQNKASSDETAIWFLRNHEAVWTQWVSPEVVDDVRQALKTQ